MINPRRWVVAVEGTKFDTPSSQPHDPMFEGDRCGISPNERIHAYDVDKGVLAHPLGRSYNVQDDWLWSTETSLPRCLHCQEIVGGDCGVGRDETATWVDEAGDWLSEQ